MDPEASLGPDARRLSSRATVIYRQLPWLILAIFAAVVVLDADMLAPPRWTLIALALVVFSILYAVVGRLWDLWIDDSMFVALRYRRVLRLSVEEVDEVGGSRFTNPEIAWLELRLPGEFGSRIRFMPPIRIRPLRHLFARHPVVQELNRILRPE